MEARGAAGGAASIPSTALTMEMDPAPVSLVSRLGNPDLEPSDMDEEGVCDRNFASPRIISAKWLGLEGN